MLIFVSTFFAEQSDFCSSATKINDPWKDRLFGSLNTAETRS